MKIPTIISKQPIIVDAVNQVSARARAAIVSFTEMYDPCSYSAEGIYYYIDAEGNKKVLQSWVKTVTQEEVDLLAGSIAEPAEELSETERRYHMLVWAMVGLISQEAAFGLTLNDWDIDF